MPTLLELRERAREQDRIRAEAEERKRQLAQQAKATRIAEIELEGDRLVEHIERALEHASGWSLIRQLDVGHKSWTGNRDWEEEALVSMWERVAQHFRDQGLNARITEEHTTEYGSDGAFAGPTITRIEIDWKEPSDD